MAARVRLLEGADFAADCHQVRAPTLVVTGSAGLDRVVDVAATRKYVDLISGSRSAEVTDTGHIGLVTKPEQFAAVVSRFLGETAVASSDLRAGARVSESSVRPGREISGPAGVLEAVFEAPTSGSPRAAVVVGHPHPQYGGTMHNKVVHRTAKAFRQLGCAVLRFNFRGVGKSQGTFDEGRGEEQDFIASLNWMAERYPEVPLWTAGFSFGAWIALNVGASDARVSLLLGIAPPTSHELGAFRRSTKPKFLIHGEGDEVVSIQDIRKLYGELEEPKELVVIDAADHLFDGRVSEVGDAIVDLLGDYAS